MASTSRKRSQEQSGRELDTFLGNLDLLNPDLQKCGATGEVQTLPQKRLQIHRREEVFQVDATESRDPNREAIHHQLIAGGSSPEIKDGVNHLVDGKRASLAAD